MKRLVPLASLVLLLVAHVSRGSTIVVTNTSDSGPGSLRQAILSAAPGDTITFSASVTGTLTLTNRELRIATNLTILGPGAKVLAISGNNASQIFYLWPLNKQALTISDLTLKNGLARGSDNNPGYYSEANGGAVYLPEGVSFSATRCSFINNVARAGNNTNATGGNAFGGAIDNSGALTLNSCTFSSNSVIGGNVTSNSGQTPVFGGTAVGGAVSFFTGPPGVTITNCTFTNNSAIGGTGAQGNGFAGGGAIEFLGSTSPTVITNCTITKNTVTGGAKRTSGTNGAGGIQIDYGSATLRSTIVAQDSTASPFSGKEVSGPVVSSSSFNFIGDGTGMTGIVNGTNANQIGTGSSPLDPKLGLLADNGGPTQTIAPSLGSLVIDRGNSFGSTTDERGQPRPLDDSTIGNAAGGNGSDIGAVEVKLPPPLRNLSTRADVLSGSQIAIGGFIVGGSASRQIVIRGLGPSLPSDISGKLADPVLTVFDQNKAIIDSNDNWKIDDQTQQSQEAAIRATGLAPANDLEAATLLTLAPGGYSAQLGGKSGTIGVGLVEVFDLTQDGNSQLVNISTRGFVATGDNVMIGGVILGASGNSTLVIDARGPSVGVSGELPDPILELHDGDGNLIAVNDDWKADSNQALIPASLSSTYDDKDSALYRVLAPGGYSAIVRGKNNNTGIALIEIFNVTPP